MFGVQQVGAQQASAAVGCSVPRTCRAVLAWRALISARNCSSLVGTVLIFLSLPFGWCSFSEQPGCAHCSLFCSERRSGRKKDASGRLLVDIRSSSEQNTAASRL